MTPEANVPLVDKGTIHTKELETNKKEEKAKENTPIRFKRNTSPHSPENYLYEGRVSYQFDKNGSTFDIYEHVINLDF